MSYFDSLSLRGIGDSAAIDSFGRLRMSTPYTLFDSKQLHDKQALFWDESIGGNATSVHSPTNARTRLTVTADSGDYAIRQTKQRFNYQPGKSQFVLMTFRGPTIDGVTARVGAFNGTGVNNLTPNNGIFFESSDIVSWNIAKNGTIAESALQANWNVDTLDGSGDSNNPSGILLDLDSPQILVLDYEWLGVGRVRVGFVIGGLIRYVHYFTHANNATFDSVYMSTPNHPLRYSIQSDGTGAGTLDHICSTVISEGGSEKNGIIRGVSNKNTQIDANNAGTTYALLGIRHKSDYIDVMVEPEWVSVFAGTQTGWNWSLQLNPTVAGTFTYSDLTNSSLQVATGATANTISSEGTIIDSGYGGSTNWTGGDLTRKIDTALRLGTTISGVRDELVLCASPFQGSSDLFGSITVREFL